MDVNEQVIKNNHKDDVQSIYIDLHSIARLFSESDWIYNCYML